MFFLPHFLFKKYILKWKFSSFHPVSNARSQKVYNIWHSCDSLITEIFWTEAFQNLCPVWVVHSGSAQAKYGCDCIKFDGASTICIILKPPTAALIALAGLLSQLTSSLYKIKVFWLYSMQFTVISTSQFIFYC